MDNIFWKTYKKGSNGLCLSRLNFATKKVQMVCACQFWILLQKRYNLFRIIFSNFATKKGANGLCLSSLNFATKKGAIGFGWGSWVRGVCRCGVVVAEALTTLPRGSVAPSADVKWSAGRLTNNSILKSTKGISNNIVFWQKYHSTLFLWYMFFWVYCPCPWVTTTTKWNGTVVTTSQTFLMVKS